MIFYDFFVRKNEFVQYEYERYVREHLIEHYENRWKQWKILWQLNVHYRIKKKKEPLLYWNGGIEEKKVGEKLIKMRGDEVGCQSATKIPKLSNNVESRNEKWISPKDLLRMLMKYDVISFDIFDTLLFRPFENPQDIFVLVGSELNVLNFYNIRRNAENFLRKSKEESEGHGEIYLSDIYEYIESQTGINAEDGMNVELNMERELCFANPYMKYIFDTLVANGKRILLVSDMYLCENDIRLLLKQCGFTNYEKVFVSCEYKSNKRDGGLFGHVLNYLNNENEKFIHIGDNEISDVKVPEKYGIETYWYHNVNAIGKKYRTDDIMGLIGSAYRGIVNQHLHNGYVRYDAYYEFGYVYGGLFAVGYANYIHQLAEQENVENIAFVARDGYILKKSYDYIFHDIHTDYILCSRISNLKMVAYKDKKSFLKEFVYRFIEEEKRISIKAVFTNMQLENLLDKLENVVEISDELSSHNLKEIIDFIEDNWSIILRTYEEMIKISRLYYAEFFEKYKKVLIVDIGWKGSGIVALRNLEKDYWHFGCEIVGVLAGSAPTRENLGQLSSKIISTYLFSPINNVECFKFHSKNCINNILTELLVGAPCPSFKGFKKDQNNEYELEFDIPETNNYEIISRVHKGIMDFVAEYMHVFQNRLSMLEISGYDAYMPLKHILSEYVFFKRYFKNYEFQDTVGGTDNINSKKVKDIFKKFNL